MAKYRATYDKHGKSSEWVDGECVWLREDKLGETVRGYSAAVVGDTPDFISPIDGSIVKGRAGMRDHCSRHDVVPNQELQGLRPRTFGGGVTVSKQESEVRKRIMHQVLDQRHHNQLQG